jgi:hypothetical protein
MRGLFAWGLMTIGALAQPTVADFAGFTATRTQVIGSDDTYRVVRVYANFTRADDRLLNLFDVQLSLSGSTSPVFLQAFDLDNEVSESFLPLSFNLPGEAWDVDSFVTIGAEQGVLTNGTVADPDFDDSGAASGAGIGGGGWYNLPPTNSHGVPGADLRVLVGQFTIREIDYAPDARVHFTATVGASSSGVLGFGTQSVKFNFTSSAAGTYVADDIDGDLQSDIVFVHPGSNQIFGWLLDGFDLKNYALLDGDGPAGATIQGLGDTDGDGKADVLWRGANGRFAISQLDGLAVAATTEFAYNPGFAWRAISFGDANGDRKADIVFHNASTGQVAVWLLDGASIASGALIGTMAQATPLAVGDINGDGNRDIVWRRSNGEIWGWLLNGTSAPISKRIGGTVVGSDWQIPVIADLDGDCMDDLIWRSRSTGMVISWKMHGLTMDAFAILSSAVSTDWTIEGSPDIDGDGKREVLWRNKSTSQTAIWTMIDHASYGGGYFTNASGAWDIVKLTELEMP